MRSIQKRKLYIVLSLAMLFLLVGTGTVWAQGLTPPGEGSIFVRPAVRLLLLATGAGGVGVPKVQMARENSSEVHLVVNTNNGDQGIVNARRLGDLMG